MMIIQSVVEYKIGIENIGERSAMEKIETIEDFKKFLSIHRSKLLEHAVSVEELSLDDDWVKDDIWDKIYDQEGEKNGKV